MRSAINDVGFNFIISEMRQISPIIDRNKSDANFFVTCENKYANISLRERSNSCAGTDMVFLEMAERKNAGITGERGKRFRAESIADARRLGCSATPVNNGGD